MGWNHINEDMIAVITRLMQHVRCLEIECRTEYVSEEIQMKLKEASKDNSVSQN